MQQPGDHIVISGLAAGDVEPAQMNEQETLDAFAEAMRVHDGKSLKPFLSDSYSIEGLPEEQGAADFFMQAMVKVKAPDEIVIIGIASERETRIAKMEFRSAERGTKERIFKFDATGRLLSADFFTLKRQ